MQCPSVMSYFTNVQCPGPLPFSGLFNQKLWISIKNQHCSQMCRFFKVFRKGHFSNIICPQFHIQYKTSNMLCSTLPNPYSKLKIC